MFVFSFEELGMPARKSDLIRNMVSVPGGCVVFSGHQYTGKTTTMYSVAGEMAKHGRTVHLILPENDETEFMSTEVPDDWKITTYPDNDEAFEMAMKEAAGKGSLLVLGGEQDKEINWAFQCAEQGELVFFQLNSPFFGIDAIYTLRTHGLPEEQIIQNLAGVVSQLLFNKVCDNCTSWVTADLPTTRLVDPDATEGGKFAEGLGCEQCEQTGFNGWVAVNEVLQVSDNDRAKLKDYISENRVPTFDESVSLSIFDDVRNAVDSGKIGIETYRRDVLANPFFRMKFT